MISFILLLQLLFAARIPAVPMSSTSTATTMSHRNLHPCTCDPAAQQHERLDRDSRPVNSH